MMAAMYSHQRPVRFQSPVACYGALIVAITGMVTLAAGCGVMDPNPGPPPVTGVPGAGHGPVVVPVDTAAPSVGRGISLYAEYCSRCHGDSAQGTLIWPASLQGRSGIQSQVRNGVRSMPSFPQISDSGIRSIELFLLSFKVDFGAKSGGELFKTFCGTCHGDSALGTSTFPGSIQGYEPIHDIVRTGRGSMAPVVIADSLLERIQEFLRGLKVDLSTLTGREYYGRVCASCHGAEGEGTQRGPEIRNPVAAFATWVIQNGRVGRPWYTDSMPRYTTAMLTSVQMAEIIGWLRSAPHPTSGKALYERFCANCHGDNGRGGPTGKKITDEIDEVSSIVRKGHGGTNYGKRGDYMPRWSSAELTSAELSAIVDYVSNLR